MNGAERTRTAFRARYQREGALFEAPGRVNLIGEHTDYNDGFVLPLAIDRSTFVAAAPRTDRRIRVYSASLAVGGELGLDATPWPRRGTFLDYVEGMVRCLPGPLRGADLLVDSDVPAGAGLSSSAALEMALGLAFLHLEGRTEPVEALARAGQRAEHEYVGTRCGIMDQLVVLAAQKGHALLVDCRSLRHDAVPIDAQQAVVIVCDTRVKHQLAASAYNDRRDECERAVAALQRALPEIRALRDVSVRELEEHAALLVEPLLRRARHVVTENERTVRAAELLRTGDFSSIGTLLYASHASLRDDFEVSCPELDAMVEAAAGCPGVWGARLTGGGFGGSTVNLVEPSAAESVTETLRRALRDRFGREARVFITAPSAGARALG